MFGAFGSIPSLYGHTEWTKTSSGFLIHTFQLKLWSISKASNDPYQTFVHETFSGDDLFRLFVKIANACTHQ